MSVGGIIIQFSIMLPLSVYSEGENERKQEWTELSNQILLLLDYNENDYKVSSLICQAAHILEMDNLKKFDI